MTTDPNGPLTSLAALSLEKCLQRLARVSAGTWQLLGVKAFSGTLADALRLHDFSAPAAVVYFNLKEIAPVTAAMLFNPAEIECVSKGFTGHSFPHGAATTPAEEVMLTELGNIVLNALINAPLNALKKSFMPASPLFIEGDLKRVGFELGKITPAGYFRVISASILIKCGAAECRCEVFTLLPEEMAQALERIQPPA